MYAQGLGYLHTEDGGLLYLNTYLAAEKKIAALLLRLEASCVRYDGADMEPLVYRVETRKAKLRLHRHSAGRFLRRQAGA